ncbi:BREX-2 system adenine-specific DNA-methyltransferase PglX [Endozoicomonas sp. 4G]|uniref:BREX-2 system adenine-specific DNA-methyltransferase PglX n=1 Tax=Endozoicomonas sp. 4G TaxID=2872754 RepID=UPI0020785F1A|nr:BREX-2 system adenine-specific DNA-methyltransferase PglX [Endozoicomonas sp. 4G]
MINRQELLKDLQRQLPKIEKDIFDYSESRDDLTKHLKEEYQKAVDAKRTAEHFVAWLEGQITQAAVAWILTCVFVRFLEDNQLLDAPMLAGPGDRLKLAKDRIEVHFNENPTHGERDYLLSLFEELEKLPAIKELLDHQHNPLWHIPVSSDGAKLLVDFFQKIDPESGELIYDFTDPEWDTRFLGDLYQDLSIAVQKKYALLQTPEFVESFILDYTLEKAQDTFGLKDLRMIDPTCGSGHFLLTGFERIFNEWCRREPGEQTRVLAQRALNSVYGVDLNPYAIAICRFRLLIAAMKVTHTQSMRQAPDFHFNLAVGDSLLHGRRFEGTSGIQVHLMEEDDPIKHVLEVEDKEKLSKILGQQYHAVVGNPPYIVVRDKALNQAYRVKYPTCHRQYSLGVPFTERFFDLTVSAKDGQPAGFMGMITANSFMKREFGTKLIQDYLKNRDLTHIIDTSGAYIPGHGTPTVILFARNRRADRNVPVRVALGIRAEPETPEDASNGKVWRSIVDQLEFVGQENEYISVDDKDRSIFEKHPWSLSGGGAVEVKATIESRAVKTLKDLDIDTGYLVITGDDESFVSDRQSALRQGCNLFVSYGIGEYLRDWSFESSEVCVWPMDNFGTQLPDVELTGYIARLWPYKAPLRNRKMFGALVESKGIPWWKPREVYSNRLNGKPLISFAFVASHNHFYLCDSLVAFNRSAPIIRFKDGDASREQYVELLGYFNSSLVGFWMKQVSHQKQLTGGDGVRVEFVSKVPYEFVGSQLIHLPIPEGFNTEIGTKLQQFAGNIEELATAQRHLSVAEALKTALSTNARIENVWDKYQKERNELRCQMVLLQEEIDWTCYWAFGLCDKKLLADIEPWMDVDLEAGQRPFEILAQLNQDGFEVPADIPAHWPEAMQNKWRQRMEAIKLIKDIRVIEDPHYKRRWIGRQGLFNKAARADELKTACKEWMLDRLENQYLKHDDQLITSAGLADRVRNDSDFSKVAMHYTGNELFDIQKLIVELVTGESIPQMAPARYKPSGITKFRAWQETWDKQRAEDVIDARTELPEEHKDYLSKEAAEHLKLKQVGEIPVPPKYATKDFAKAAYWPLRGKLDVPKERFFSLPGCEKSGDTTPVIGWAGMNHLQRALAIVGWYQARKEEDGFTGQQLMPMLVAIEELIPWLKQWHNELDPEFELKMGDYFEGWLNEELQELDITRDDLLSWTPPVVKKTRKRKTKAKA